MGLRDPALRRPSLWKIPALVLVAGLLLTGIFSAQQHDSEQRRVAARFEASAEQLETALASAMSERISEFTVVRDFIESQPIIANADLREFLSRRAGGLASEIASDAGLVVTENVTDLAALEARERALGRPDFTILSPLALGDQERIVVTHVENDFPVMGRDFAGIDITSFSHFLQSDSFENVDDPSRVHVAVTTYTELFGNFRLLGETNFPDREVYEDAALYLVSAYETSDGSSTGYMAKLEAIGAIIQSVADQVPAETMLTVHMADEPAPIASIDNRSSDTTADSARLLFMVSSLDHVIDLKLLTFAFTAGDEFGSDGATGSQTRVWGIGLGLTALVMFAAFLRARQARRLIDTGLELELAQTMAATDPLTGLFNRQGLIDSIERPVPRPGTLLFIDIDNFKSVNDGDGHAEGDELLRAIGEALRTTVRSTDVVCRLHGDEFLVFLPYPVEPSRVHAVKASIELLVSGLDSRISCSIGMSSRTAEAPVDLDELVRRADLEMYSEKRSKQ